MGTHSFIRSPPFINSATLRHGLLCVCKQFAFYYFYSLQTHFSQSFSISTYRYFSGCWLWDHNMDEEAVPVVGNSNETSSASHPPSDRNQIQTMSAMEILWKCCWLLIICIFRQLLGIHTAIPSHHSATSEQEREAVTLGLWDTVVTN